MRRLVYGLIIPYLGITFKNFTEPSVIPRHIASSPKLTRQNSQNQGYLRIG